MLFWNTPRTPFFYQKKSLTKKTVKSPFAKIYKNPRLASVAWAYITGNKKGMGRKINKAHRHLNLLHLFTPSGLHFSVVAFIVLKLTVFLRRFGKFFSLAVFLPLYIGPFFLTGYYAIKRIAEYKIVAEILKQKRIHIDKFWVFLGVFLLDFIFGTYQHSPLSYSFSYLFLGIVFCLKDIPRFFWPFAFLGGQVLAAFCFETPLTYTGFYWGFLLVSLFSLVFPIILLNCFIPYINFSEFFVDKFIRLVHFFADISVASGFFYPEWSLVLVVLLINIKWIPRCLIIFLFVITSFPIYNVPRYAFKRAKLTGNLPYFETSSIKRAASKGKVNIWRHRMRRWSPVK